MTDHSKIYVYTGSQSGYINGHWYYYSGSAWADGGVYNETALETDKTLTVSNSAADAKVTGDNIFELNNNIAEVETKQDELADAVAVLQMSALSKVDGAYVEEGYLYLTSDGEIVAGPLGPFSGGGGSGGGGSSGNAAVLTVSNTTGWITHTVASGEDCEITFDWVSLENDLPTGIGNMTISVNSATKLVRSIEQGSVSVNLASYLVAGTNLVAIRVSDVYGNARTIRYTITVVMISLASSFDASTPYTGAINFSYTPTGNVEKTMHFILDGVQIGTATTSVSGRQQTYIIQQQSHGAHSFEEYFTCDINGEQVESNHLYYEIICLEPANNTPIIVSSFNTSTVGQYTTLSIPYTVYDPVGLMADVTLSVNGTSISELTVDRTEHVWAYRADIIGDVELTITSGNVTKTIGFTVTESDIDVRAETDSLALYLTSYGRSNNEANPGTWIYNNVSATMTDFNFTSDGWQHDKDGVTVLRVSGDARVTIPYQIFGADFRGTGKTIEVEFATKDVRNYDAPVFSCMSGGRGITLTAQKASMASEQSEISMQYKEDEHVRISFVVEKRSENRLIYIYVNGIMSGTVRYPENDDFSQVQPVGISIGSNDATIDIYCIRVYDNDLTRSQVLNNWIADTQNVSDMLARYARNNVYDQYGSIVISQLPSDLPYLIIECPELPQYKGDKKTASGSYVDPVMPSNGFTYTGAQIDVQGTSSQYYERKNYKIKFKNGFTLNSGTQSSKYIMRVGAIPTSTFCFKADVASSEGANNVELARLYNDTCVYSTPAQSENPSVRQGIDGFPIVIFWNDGNKTTFLGKYNFNNDKSTEEVFGFVDGDESWEIRNNTSDRVLWKSDDYESNGVDEDGNAVKAWLNDFEARFPDLDPAYEDSTQLKTLATWLKSTDRDAATGDLLDNPVQYGGVEYTADTAEYRLAKFKAEAGGYIELQSAIYYYLFTELFLMVDSRAKNAFPSFIGASVVD